LSHAPAAAPSAIRPECRALFEKLIALDTTSRNSNLELIDFVQDYLQGHGISSKLVFNEDKTKANLYATLGPTDRPGIALSGHTDVVPIDGQDWSSDPWTVTEKEARLYGRGTCDMKGFIAIALAFAPEFLKADPKTPIHYCLSYDEEVGCLGVPRLLEHLEKQAVKPAMCIVGEPTDMKVITAHKGKLSTRCHIRGKEAHSSLAPQGVNAISAAAKVINYLDGMAQRKAEEGPFDNAYDVPHTTIHTGVVNGGTQLNIVPGQCSFEFEFRNLPQDDPRALLSEVQAFASAEVEPAMKRIDPETGFTWEQKSFFPGLNIDEKEEVVSVTKALSGSNDTGKVAFGTEAGLFHQYGIPVVICGPGSIEQAHKPDEYVSLEQLAICERFMERLIDRVAQS